MTFRVLFKEQVFIPERWAAGTKDEQNFLTSDSYRFVDGNLVIDLADTQITYYFPAQMWNEVKSENHPPG